jgi:hypothetical protein
VIDTVGGSTNLRGQTMIGFFEYVEKANAAKMKWGQLSDCERNLVSMTFIHTLCAKSSHIKVDVEEHVLPDGRSLSMLRLEMEFGEFVFLMPHYTDGLLVLKDFQLFYDIVAAEGIAVNPC